MSWKKTLKLVFLIEIAVLLALYVLFGTVFYKPVPTVALSLPDDVRAEFPVGEYQPVSSQEWEGFRFAFGFRLFSRPSSNTEKEFAGLINKGFPGSRLRRPISLFDQGLYVYGRRQKGYILTAVWRLGDRLYWADTVSFSTLDRSVNFFHRFLQSVQIGGQATDERLGRELTAIRSHLSPLLIQSPGQLVLMIGGIMLLVGMLIYPLMKWAGAAPRNEADFEFCTPQATLVTRRWGKRNSSPCCVCKRGDSLLVFRFRRQVLEIRLSTERKYLVVKKRSLAYKSQRLIPDNEDDFQRWLMAASLHPVNPV